MKRPTTLLYRVLLNEGLQVGCAVERDAEEIRRRFEHEGMSFLTITLPVLSEALETGLSQGRITPLMFNGFKPFKRGGSLPALLSGFFIRVFRSDGELLDCPCIDSIRAIRQISRLFKKVELPCSSARIKRAYERYISNDSRVSDKPGDRCASDPSLWTWVIGHLWSDLEILSGELYCFPGVFGTGATAERLLSNERWTIREWPVRAETSFPSDYHTTSENGCSSFEGIHFVKPEDERPVRVVQVPKTLKTPRTISVEPSYMMLMQQSIAKPLMRYLEGNTFPYNCIRFTDQSVNNDMARVGSIDGSLSTIDLSDASDLVSNNLVKSMFKTCPTFLDFIQDCRTSRAQLPDSSVIELQKFASMGSALCFPIEAMTFFSITCYSLLRQSGRRPSPKLLKELTARVSVYGDDIIVPTEMAAGVMEDLELFGLKVNHEKSFSSGYFRESCGGDYYRGHNVTPAYVRRFDFAGVTRDPQIVATYVSLSNQFYMKGLWHVSQYIREQIDDKLGQLPISATEIGGLHYTSVFNHTGCRWNERTHSYMVRSFVLVPRRQKDTIQDSRGAMLRAFQSRYHSKCLADFSAVQFGLFDDSVRHNAWYHDRSVESLSFHGFYNRRHERFNDRHLCMGQTRMGNSPRRACSEEDRLSHLQEIASSDPHTSVRPYALKLKRRWIPTKVGISF